MTNAEGSEPDPVRAGLIRSVFEPSTLESVAEAVSAATEDETRLYVERIGTQWRWSLVHSGGPYPLLRITARFLRMDYHSIVCGFRTIADDACVLSANPDEPDSADAWALIDFDGPTPSATVKERILGQLHPGTAERTA